MIHTVYPDYKRPACGCDFGECDNMEELCKLFVKEIVLTIYHQYDNNEDIMNLTPEILIEGRNDQYVDCNMGLIGCNYINENNKWETLSLKSVWPEVIKEINDNSYDKKYD
jgi:hypothetical protein